MCSSSAAPAAAIDMQPGRDLWYHEEIEKVSADCPPEQMNAEDPLFILYTSGSTGKPKGVLHTTGGYLVYVSMTHRYRLRLPRRRHLLVHRRCRLGDRAHLHRLRAARERRDDADVRGRAELSERLALLGGDRQARRQHLLHRADRHPRADGRRRGASEEDLAQIAEAARHGRRADQSGSLGMVSPRRRRRPLPDRRHLVADGDGRHHDHAAARRHRAEAGLRHAALLRRQAGAGRRRGQAPRRRRRAAISCSPIPGPARCAPSMATTSASSTPTSPPTRASISPATAAAATPTAITGSPAASTTC